MAVLEPAQDAGVRCQQRAFFADGHPGRAAGDGGVGAGEEILPDLRVDVDVPRQDSRQTRVQRGDRRVEAGGVPLLVTGCRATAGLARLDEHPPVVLGRLSKPRRAGGTRQLPLRRSLEAIGELTAVVGIAVTHHSMFAGGVQDHPLSQHAHPQVGIERVVAQAGIEPADASQHPGARQDRPHRDREVAWRREQVDPFGASTHPCRASHPARSPLARDSCKEPVILEAVQDKTRPDRGPRQPLAGGEERHQLAFGGVQADVRQVGERAGAVAATTDHAEPGITGDGVQDVPGRIAAAVIDDEALDVAILLIADALQTLGEAAVIAGPHDHDRNQRPPPTTDDPEHDPAENPPDRWRQPPVESLQSASGQAWAELTGAPGETRPRRVRDAVWIGEAEQAADIGP